jgi:hypothetical protein
MSRPGLGDQSLRVGEQLRQGLCADNGRHEVLVTGPEQDHVLVEVRRDARAGDVPWLTPMWNSAAGVAVVALGKAAT